MKKQTKLFPKIRHVPVPPSRVHENKVKPVSRARMRRTGQKEIGEGIKEIKKIKP